MSRAELTSAPRRPDADTEQPATPASGNEDDGLVSAEELNTDLDTLLAEFVDSDWD
jgi:hypothetical protein